MASYRVLIKPSAAKEIEALPNKDRRRVVNRIRRLGIEPRPPQTEKLSGTEKYRLRQGDDRILYLIGDADRAVIVVKVGHRREVYR